jgi:ATP/maltotriose-dependent transcriptional regulator MalT
MASLPQASAAWHRAAMLVVIVRSWTGRASELGDALAGLRVDPAEAIAAWHLIAWAGVAANMFRLGRNEDALLFVERVERRAAEVGPDEAPLHIVRHYRAYFWSHEPEVAVVEAEAAAAILEHAGEAGTRDTMIIAAADCAITLGTIKEAEDTIRAWLAGVDDRNHLVASAKMSLARALLWQGRHDEALVVGRDAMDRAVAVKHVLREGQSRCILAEILAASGDLANAMEQANAATKLLAYSVVSHPQALSVTARIHLVRGEATDALVAARAAHQKMIADSVVNDVEADVRLVYAEALEATGDRAEALTGMTVARDRLRARAATITTPERRERFLTDVPTHARTMRLADEWLGGADGARAS